MGGTAILGIGTTWGTIDVTSWSVSWDRALRWRMQRQHLVTRSLPTDLPRVVGDIGGLHAQLMSSAELSAHARIDGLSREAIADALWHDRSLVKLWAIRSTLHLLPTQELGMWTAALATHTKYGNTGHPEIERLAVVVGRALAGRMCSREELAAEVERDTGSKELGDYIRSSWGEYLKPISFRGDLCFAPSAGGRAHFTTPRTWVPRAMAAPPDAAAALREVTRRFLSAYGPATGADLALWWGGYGPRRGERMIADLGEEAIRVDVEGEHQWMLARDLHELESARVPDTARLLPAFDPWVLGASRKGTKVIDPQHRSRVYRPQGWISPTILVNGRMTGVWQHELKGGRLLVRLQPFDGVSGWVREHLEAEAKRLALYLGGSLTVEWNANAT